MVLSKNNTSIIQEIETICKKKHCKACPITNVDEIPLVLSVDDLCEILRIGKNSAYALIKSGDLSSCSGPAETAIM